MSEFTTGYHQSSPLVIVKREPCNKAHGGEWLLFPGIMLGVSIGLLLGRIITNAHTKRTRRD